MISRQKCTVFLILIFTASFILVSFVQNIFPVPHTLMNNSLDDLPSHVWKHSKSSHPYSLSPFPDSKDNIYHQKKSFNLSGIGTVYPRKQTEEKPIPRFPMNISLGDLPPLVWKHSESSHPYFLSPVLEFKDDIYRQKKSFNLSGMDAVYTRAQTAEKLILIYNIPTWLNTKQRNEINLDNCKVQSCKLSNDRNLLPRAQAVVFHVIELSTHLNAPPKPDNQMWVFFAWEAPWNFPLWNNMFNWTMTFRLESDIVCPYHVIMLKSPPDVRDFKSITRQKSAPVMWLVSHCGARSKRDEYVRELQKHIQVDIYGGCGPFKCAKSGFKSCNKIQSRKYKFYLAFENSICRGYITEKLFRSYTLDIVPVVRGGARYSELLPPGTYINTADFASPQMLAAHLKYLDGNETEYVKMLERKSQFTISSFTSTMASSMCDICVKLHDLPRFSNSYSNINKWWSQGTCREPTDF